MWGKQMFSLEHGVSENQGHVCKEEGGMDSAEATNFLSKHLLNLRGIIKSTNEWINLSLFLSYVSNM